MHAPTAAHPSPRRRFPTAGSISPRSSSERGRRIARHRVVRLGRSAGAPRASSSCSACVGHRQASTYADRLGDVATSPRIAAEDAARRPPDRRARMRRDGGSRSTVASAAGPWSSQAPLGWQRVAPRSRPRATAHAARRLAMARRASAAQGEHAPRLLARSGYPVRATGRWGRREPCGLAPGRPGRAGGRPSHPSASRRR
jgi:hypothetical protein